MILEQNTFFNEIKNSSRLTVYHSCSVPNLNKRFKNNPDKNIHAGTLYQAICRADYKVNDEELYDEICIHEIDISLEGLYPKMVIDDGENANSIKEDKFKPKWNLLVYKNVGEGDIRDNNLSVIILNKSNILSVKLYGFFNGEELESMMKSYK